jgi:hypothetical protein
MNFKEICNILDERDEKYLSGESKTYSVTETWEKLKKRKGTFLTRD